MNCVNIHHIEPCSRVNGPGVMFTIWFQGCFFNCQGCFNPETHSTEVNQLIPVHEIILDIKGYSKANKINGVTLIGGEPFLQAYPLHQLVRGIRNDTDLPILLFSGYTLKEIKKIEKGRDVLSYVDALIDGRFDKNQILKQGLMGSSNQKIHFFTSAWTSGDFMDIPDCEIIISPDGQIRISGISPVNFINTL